MKTHSEINQGLYKAFDAFAQHIQNESDALFEQMPDKKWSSGQNLEHLIRSTQPVLLAMKLPKFILGWYFGKSNRPSRSYEELKNRYNERLAKGGTASGRFVPPSLSLAQKETKTKQFLALQQKLSKVLNHWSDKELETYILPHPLLGKLTMREMLYFTAYHTDHHRNILEERKNS